MSSSINFTYRAHGSSEASKFSVAAALRSIVLSVFASMITLLAVAQHETSLAGTIKSATGHPIKGVTITVKREVIQTLSDGRGNFFLGNLPLGRQQVEFSFPGYQSQVKEITFEAGQQYEISIVLEESYFTLSEVTVRASIRRPGERSVLAPIHNAFITAGKKSEVIQVDGMHANLAEKTGRQLFAKIPGVFVYDMDGSGNQLNIATRGLDPHRSWEYNVRQNGVMTNSDIYGYPASHYSPPMESIRRVELQRGTSSLQYGAAFGGMINYVTKSADTTRELSFEQISSAGSFGLLSTYNAVGGRLGKLTYYGYHSVRKSNGYRRNATSNYQAQYLSLQYQMNTRARVKAEFARMEYLYQIPGPLTDSMFHADPRSSTRERNFFNPDIYVPSLHFDWDISSSTQLNIIASAVLGKRNSVQFIGFANQPDTPSRTTGAFANRQVDIDGFNSFTTELRLLHRYSIGRWSSALSSGVRLIHNNTHRRQIGNGTSGTGFDLNVQDPGFGRNLQLRTRNVALFAENLLRITDQLSITPGIRYELGESYMSGTISYYDPGNVPKSIPHQFPLFGISSEYRFGRSSRIYAGWSEAYRPVLFSDIIPATPIDRTAAGLKDSRGFNAELGISGEKSKWLRYDINVFMVRYNNRIGSIIVHEPGGNSHILKTNVGSSLTKGLELFAEVNPVAMLELPTRLRWSVFTSTSFFDGRYTAGNIVAGNLNRSVAGNRLETVPRWISRNGVTLGIHKFSGTLQYSYVSSSYSDALNTEQPNASGSAGRVPAYSLLDFNASTQIGSMLTLRLSFNNLLDKQYFTKRPTGYPGAGVWPSDGRNISATVQIRL